MSSFQQTKTSTEEESAAQAPSVELKEGLALHRRKATRNSTHQLARRQNLMNNLVQVHGSGGENQSTEIDNYPTLNDYHVGGTKPFPFGGYPYQLFHTKNVNYAKF